MRLNLQDVIEVGSIQVRITFLLKQAFSNFPDSFNTTSSIHKDELNAFKITLENFLTKTDDKEE